MATRIRFELTISAVTGRHVRPLHHRAARKLRILVYPSMVLLSSTFCKTVFLGDRGGWGLRTLSHRHFERKREIFVIRGQNGQCLEAANGKPALQETFGHRHDRYSAALLIFMRRPLNLLNPLNLVHAQSKGETSFPYFSTDDTIPVFYHEIH